MEPRSLMVLYVDDDQDCLDVMRTILDSQGHAMTSARTAEDGLKAYKDSRPDLIFVDLMMEEIDAGAQFAREIRSRGDDLPIYLISSVGDAMRRSTVFSDLGITDVIQKPIRGESVLTMLKSRSHSLRVKEERDT